MTSSEQVQIQREALPKVASFTSVTDVLLINLSEESAELNNVKSSLTTTTTTTKVTTEHDDGVIADDVDDVPRQHEKKSVRFGSIERREYNRIVGDHPDVKVGPPVTFGWEYGTVPSMTLDEYEEWKISYRQPQHQRPSSSLSFGVRKMSSITRKNMLRTLFDVSEEEIIAAEREIQRIQKQRNRTIHQSTASAVVESNFRRAGRKVRQSLGKVIVALSVVPIPSYAIPSY